MIKISKSSQIKHLEEQKIWVNSINIDGFTYTIGRLPVQNKNAYTILTEFVYVQLEKKLINFDDVNVLNDIMASKFKNRLFQEWMLELSQGNVVTDYDIDEILDHLYEGAESSYLDIIETMPYDVSQNVVMLLKDFDKYERHLSK